MKPSFSVQMQCEGRMRTHQKYIGMHGVERCSSWEKVAFSSHKLELRDHTSAYSDNAVRVSHI